MSSKDNGSYSKKHSPDRQVDPGVAKAVKGRVKDGKITCAAAFGVVKELDTSPSEVGFTIDSLEIKIAKCQMGIFGYDSGKRPFEQMKRVSDELAQALGESLNEGKLACASAWEIANRLGIKKMEVTSACEKLKIKVSPCQLGAF